jgi:hypothetical protein
MDVALKTRVADRYRQVLGALGPALLWLAVRYTMKGCWCEAQSMTAT